MIAFVAAAAAEVAVSVVTLAIERQMHERVVPRPVWLELKCPLQK